VGKDIVSAHDNWPNKQPVRPWTALGISERVRSFLKFALWAPTEDKDESWRPHIDGLRAVSVLVVVFYHLGIFAASGGFVGVDVFFVISGFLISRVIYDEIASHGKFRIVRFYERRARRILPAFFVVTASTLIAGYFLFLPDEFVGLSRSAIYASGFAANIFFYHISGYFAGTAVTKPLLHYWSLGVEEQFYIVFPLVVLVVFKITSRLLSAAVIAIAAASLALAQTYLRTDPTAAFYLTPPRAWELMAGCLLALPHFPYSKQRVLCEIMAAIGLGLILFAASKYSYATPFPGAAAAVPVAGAAFILWSCERSPTFVGALLSVRLLRSIGLWSYSIYMIHWPLIVFARVVWPHGAFGLTSAIAFAATSLGWLSYRFIETPIRAQQQLFNRPRLFAASAIALVFLAMASAAIASMGGFPQRLSAQVREILAYNHYDYAPRYREGICFISETDPLGTLRKPCFNGSHPSVLLWGDSTAAHYYEALRRLFPDVAILQANMSSCPPIIGIERSYLVNCKDFNDLVLQQVEKNRPDLVLLSALWPYDGDALPKLDATLKTLLAIDIPVTIIGRSPIFIDTVPNILARRLMRGDSSILGGDDGTGAPFWGDYYMKSRYSNWHGLRYISFQDTVCKENKCTLETDSGVPKWWDEYHFTFQGATLALKRLLPYGLLPATTH
jgi:peptidoglycan/LPS O-acetylase OafA/YrhL